MTAVGWQARRVTFDELVAEGAAAPVAGWDFSWFDGRASEERPSWGYLGLMSARMASVDAALDVQTGGGEVLAAVARRPPLLAVAADSWPPPNGRWSRRTCDPLGVHVVAASENGGLPFRDATFDLVVSRHPIVTPWPEVARVLRPGGTYLSQQIGAGTNRELTDAIMSPQPVSGARDAHRAVAQRRQPGLASLTCAVRRCACRSLTSPRS